MTRLAIELTRLLNGLDLFRNKILIEGFIADHGNVNIEKEVIFEEMPLVLALTDTAHLTIARGTFIRSHVAFKIEGHLSIGANCYIGPFTFFNVRSSIAIGNNVLIGEMVSLVDHEHEFVDSAKPISEQGFKENSIVIEDNVWIGAGCRILSGVTLHQGSIVGAGAVVTESIPPMSIAVGVPARVRFTR